MKDQITLDRIKLIHPILRDEVGVIYNEICEALTGRAVVRFTHTFRTFAEQDALFAKGRTKPGPKVTNARSGSSWHNYGMAIDIVLLVDKNKDGVFESASWDLKTDFDGDGKSDWIEVVQIFKEYGWEWGGDWKFFDAPHFQKTLGQTIRGMLAKHNYGKVDKNGFVIL
jgi:peptidoglycan L-alanyl-D-glutamate endopeptidase CwlK